MADTKFLDYAGLRYFKEKLDTEYEDKIGVAIEQALPTPDGTTIVADSGNVWSAKLPTGGAITSGADGLELDLTKIAGNTLKVESNKLETVVDGVTIKTKSPDETTGKTALYVDLDGIIDNETIKKDGNGKLYVDPEELDIPEQFTLEAATTTKLGGIKVGNGLEMVDSTEIGSADKLQVKAANDTITVSAEGIKVTAGKYAPLVNEKIPGEYLPSYVDDVIEGYLVEEEEGGETVEKFYTTRTGSGTEQDPYVYSDEVTPEASKIYVDLDSTDTYRWSGSTFVNISGAAIDIITNSEIDALFVTNP